MHHEAIKKKTKKCRALANSFFFLNKNAANFCSISSSFEKNCNVKVKCK